MDLGMIFILILAGVIIAMIVFPDFRKVVKKGLLRLLSDKKSSAEDETADGHGDPLKTKIYHESKERPASLSHTLYYCQIDNGPKLKVLMQRELTRRDFPGADNVVSHVPLTIIAESDGLFARSGNRNQLYINGERVVKGQKIKLSADNEIRIQVDSGFETYNLRIYKS